LATLVGYHLRPGVSASTFLAFTMEKDHAATIPQGTRAQSLPGPGQLPQPFETSANLEASALWNDLAPRLTAPMYITQELIADLSNPSALYFEGVATNLKPGDPLLFLFGTGPGEQVFRQVATVEPQPPQSRTLVTLQSVPPAAAVVIAHAHAVMEIVGHHLQLDRFKVSPGSGTAKRVTSFLRKQGERVGKIKKDLTDFTKSPDPEAQLKNLIGIIQDDTLPVIQEEHADAAKNKHGQLEQWLGHLTAQLNAASAALMTALPKLKFQKAGQSAVPSSTSRIALEVGLHKLFGPLQIPPSVPPANSLRLDRTVRQTYGLEDAGPTKGKDVTPGLPDIGTQLLGALRSSLRDSLPAALANAKVSQDSDLLSANALRVKAAPFGHNAPLKPILDGNGIVVGHEEWPLAGFVSIRLDFSNNTGERATVSLSQNGAVQTLVVSPIQGSEDFTFQNGWKLTVSRPNVQPPKTAYTFEAPTGWKKKIAITTVFNQGNLTVTINGNPPQQVGSLHTVQYSVEGQRITISNQDESSFVLDDTFLAPSDAQARVLALDAQYDQIIPGSWVALDLGTPDPPLILEVASVRTVSKADYGITGTVTELTFATPWITSEWLSTYNNSLAAFRNVTVYAQNTALALAEAPIEQDISGDTIELDGLYSGLKSGRWIIVSGERTDTPGTSGVMASELLMLVKSTQGVRKVALSGGGSIDLPGDHLHTTIQLAQGGLSYTYKRDTVTVYGNVVNATHGETRNEVLGSGDGSKILQQFALRQSPVTYLAAATPAGAASTLQTRVNDILWHESDTLAELVATDRKYITKTDDLDKTTLVFGNGVFGSRLPSGAENIKALYRTSIGTPGNVKARQISLLATKPFGVKAVINPLPATGGADRDTRDQARRNVPIAVLALDRLVSVQDYADFCRSYAGIGKASSVRLSDGRRQLVEVTIAGNDDIPIDKSSDLYRNLLESLRDFGDPYEPIQLDLRELFFIVLSAKVRILPDYLWEAVEPKIRQKLLFDLGFDRRELGQDVLLSEVIAAIQNIEGVAYVDVDVFAGVSEAIAASADALENQLKALANMATQAPPSRLPMKMARPESGEIRPAQIAYLTPVVPDTLILKELKP
jgi:predicted phage baseplate assembly protein